MSQVAKKFFKGFITGGLSAVVVALSVGVSIHSLDDLKGLAILLGTAFLSGAVHAVAEMITPSVPVAPSV